MSYYDNNWRSVDLRQPGWVAKFLADTNLKEVESKPMATVDKQIEVNVNGITIKGPSTKVFETMKTLGLKMDESKYYFSDSKGQYIEINTMVPEYARNAFIKRLKKRIDETFVAAKSKTNQEFVILFVDRDKSLIDNDPTLFALLNHIHSKS